MNSDVRTALIAALVATVTTAAVLKYLISNNVPL